MALGKLDNNRQKNILHYSQKLTQNGLKTVTIRPETVEHKENIGKKLLDIGLGDNFLVMTLKEQATTVKISKRDHIKLKKLLCSKRTINKMKTQSTEQEKIFSNHILGKELISKIKKELI